MDGFKIKSKMQLIEEIIKLSEDDLKNCLANKKHAYIEYKKRKKSGHRIIHSIKRTHNLFIAQNNLQNSLFQNMLFPECVCGFRKRKSYYDFLVPHVSSSESRYYLRLDISDFFDSIRKKDVEQALEYYVVDEIAADEKKWIINTIVDIITLDNKTIQGAVTSPTLSNLVFRSLDIRIEKYCKKMDVVYTRYADDMLFSSNASYIHNYKFTNMIKTIISEKGFSLNYSKILKYKNEISLDGYVVGIDIRLSRKKLEKLNRIIFNMEKKAFKGFKSLRSMYITKNKLAGYRSFLIQSLKYINNEHKAEQVKHKISIIESLITKYCIE